MGLDLLTSISVIIKSRYYDLNDTTCIVNISVWKQYLWFNMVYNKPFNGKLNLIHSDILVMHMGLDSNGLIIKSRYYDFNDTTCIVSVEITFMV